MDNQDEVIQKYLERVLGKREQMVNPLFAVMVDHVLYGTPLQGMQTPLGHQPSQSIIDSINAPSEPGDE